MTKAEKLADIKKHLGNHKHSFDELVGCCWHEQAIDSELMEAHRFPGSRCDVIEGYCSCGGVHTREAKVR